MPNNEKQAAIEVLATAPLQAEASAPLAVPSLASQDEGSRILAVIQHSLDKGLSVEAMKGMFDLYERVQERTARVAFFNALAKFKREIPRITHDKDTKKANAAGGKFAFTYASKAAIMEAIQPHLDANGLFMTFDTRCEKPGIVTEVAWLHHVDGHKESSEVTLPTDSNLPIGPQQKVGSAMSYGQRYAIIAVLGLSLNEAEDDEAQPAMVPITEEQAATIAAIAAEVGVPVAKVCQRFSVESLSALPQGRYNEAVRALEARRKGAAS